MKYALLFVCLLFLPSVFYGMEMDPEAAEEGRASPNFERNQRLEEILQQINEWGDLTTLLPNKQKKQELASLMEKAGACQEATVVLGHLLKQSQDELNKSKQRENAEFRQKIRLLKIIKKKKFISITERFCLTTAALMVYFTIRHFITCS